MEPTKEEIKQAFLDVMDGCSARLIQSFTGLTEERCIEIKELYFTLIRKTTLTKS